MRKTRRPIAALFAGMGTLLLAAAAWGQESATTSTSGPILNLIDQLTALVDTPTVVEPGEDTLADAVAEAEPGDTLELQPGLYLVTSTIVIDKDLTIRGATHHPEDVHIAAVGAEEFDFQPAEFPDPLDQGHILFVTSGAQHVRFRYFTIKNAPETDIDEGTCEEEPPFGFGLNHAECFGDGIHSDGAAELVVEHVNASLNAGNGIWVDGAETAKFRHIQAVNNGAFGIDVDTALELSIRKSRFIANQISGVEASGHEKGTPRADYVAEVRIEGSLARGNGEIGIEFERFKKARVKNIVSVDNREDGFDADRVSEVKITDSSFLNNLDDAIELFPVNVPPEEQPADFPGSTIMEFDDLVFEGNVGEDVHTPPTEN